MLKVDAEKLFEILSALFEVLEMANFQASDFH